MPNLTKRFVESITPDPDKLSQYWDESLKGFGVIVLPSGRRTYCIQYRNQNRVLKRLKIGVHGQLTTEEARALARKHLASVAHGEDPSTQNQDTKKLPLIKDLAQDYLERHASKKRSYKEDKRMIEKIILPALGDQQVQKVSRRDIESLHLQLEKTSVQGNRVLALLSKMFTLALKWGWCSEHPVKGIQRYHEEKRDIWLRDQELNRFWEAVERYPTRPPALALKILIYTGARKNELLKATWDQFELEKGVWTKPPRSMKDKKLHHLPLSEQTVAVLKALKTMNTKNSSYLFPGPKGDKPLEDIKRFWNKIRKEADIEEVHIHDLRHTYASHLVSSGLSLSIVGKLLGHTQASTTQRYAHLADEPLREATALFGAKMDELMAKKG